MIDKSNPEEVGVIFGMHKNNHDPKHFTVLGFIRGNEWPRKYPNTEVRSHIETGGYTKVWFQPTHIPGDTDA